MLSLTLVATPTAALSTLASSRWRLKLNFGLEDGSWMPKTVDGWGESGARLLVTTDVAFEDGIVVRPRDASGRSVDGETLVGPPGDTRVLRVLQTSSVVTERGVYPSRAYPGLLCERTRHRVQATLLDPTAEAGVAYLYRIQGITEQGMTSSSSPVSVRPASHDR